MMSFLKNDRNGGAAGLVVMPAITALLLGVMTTAVIINRVAASEPIHAYAPSPA